MGDSRPQMSVAPALVEFRGISKSYDGKHAAVDNLSCAIRQGEFLSFLGPSGSGKTTALMMLAGFEAPTAGDIFLNGRSLSRTPAHRRNMGVVFQNYALFPHLTVAQNIAFPLSVRKMAAAEIQQRVRHALDLVQLCGFEQRRPAELSGGQQQRVALARALIFGPALVLMDEPLGALDKQLREQLQVEIKHLQQQLGVTVIYVTHDQSEALTLSDRIAVFNRGTIQQIGSPREIYEHPANAFVAQFVGRSNRLDGRVISVEAGRCLVRAHGNLLIRAQLVGAVALGNDVTLSIRPQRLLIERCELVTARGMACTEMNWFAARVEEILYHGDHSTVRMSLEGGAQLIADPESRAGESLEVGARVSVGWLPQHCRAFEAVK